MLKRRSADSITNVKTTVVIPVYNNPDTVVSVAVACRRYAEDVLVVDDGSRQLPDGFEEQLQTSSIRLIRHETNRGKGAALQTALDDLVGRHVDYMIVLDADGQHHPEDIPAFQQTLETSCAACDAIVVGVREFTSPNVPRSSIFGRAFSNFWVRLETGVSCHDTQSGFRAYPVVAVHKLSFLCARYTFEIEVLVRGIWGGLRVVEIPIHCTYTPVGERVSHFRPVMDNLRLTVLHTSLVARRLLPWPNRRIVPKPADAERIPSMLRSPRAFVRYLFSESATPGMLALSAAVGTFLAVLPLFSCHMVVILYVCLRLHLNKVMALGIQNLFMPPVTPLLCVVLGHYMRYGEQLAISRQTLLAELHQRFYEWLLGSLVLAPLFAVMMAIIVYGVACWVQSRRSRHIVDAGDGGSA